MKKIIALIMSAVLMMTSISFTAFAESETESEKITDVNAAYEMIDQFIEENDLRQASVSIGEDGKLHFFYGYGFLGYIDENIMSTEKAMALIDEYIDENNIDRSIVGGYTALTLWIVSPSAEETTEEAAEPTEEVTETTESEKITDVNVAYEMIDQFIEENDLRQASVSIGEDGKLNMNFRYLCPLYPDENIMTNEKAIDLIDEYIDSNNIDRNLIGYYVVAESAPSAEETTESEKITDVNAAYEMIDQFIEENDLRQASVSIGEDGKLCFSYGYGFLGYIDENIMSTEKAMALIDEYIDTNYIDRSLIGGYMAALPAIVPPSDEETTEEAAETTEEATETTESTELTEPTEPTVKKAQASISDIDGDGKIDSKDATVVLVDYAGMILGKEPTVDLAVSDVNGDGKADSKDATMVLVFYAESMLE